MTNVPVSRTARVKTANTKKRDWLILITNFYLSQKAKSVMETSNQPKAEGRKITESFSACWTGSRREIETMIAAGRVSVEVKCDFRRSC